MARIRFISACQRTVPTTSPPTPAAARGRPRTQNAAPSNRRVSGPTRRPAAAAAGWELLAEAGHPTEQPEGGVLDLDSSGPPGRDGVAELVRGQGAEEQPGPGQPGEPEGPQAIAGQPNGRI
jgi:hypothetical protein